MHWSRAPAAVARRSLTFFAEAWPVLPSITSSVNPFARRSRRAGESSTVACRGHHFWWLSFGSSSRPTVADEEQSFR